MKGFFTGLITVALVFSFAFLLPSKVNAAVGISVTPDGGEARTITSDVASAEVTNFSLGDCGAGCVLEFTGLEALGTDNYVDVLNEAALGESVVLNGTEGETTKFNLTTDFAAKYGRLSVKIKSGEEKEINLIASDYIGFNISNTSLNAYNNYSALNRTLMFGEGEKTYNVDVNYLVDSLSLKIPSDGTNLLGAINASNGITSASGSELKIASGSSAGTYTVDLLGKTFVQSNTLSMNFATSSATLAGKLKINKVALKPSNNNGVVTVDYEGLTNAQARNGEISNSWALETFCVYAAPDCTGKNKLAFDPYLIVLYYDGDTIKGVKQFKMSEIGQKNGTTDAINSAFSFTGMKVLDPANNIGYSGVDKITMFISKGQFKVSSYLPELHYGIDEGYAFNVEGSDK